jgi:hypothetical protein
MVASTVTARTTITLVGDEIPRHLYVGVQGIFLESDSLYLNGHQLLRAVDYSYDEQRRWFDLSRLSVTDDDTLKVVYHALPRWLLKSYGRPLPSSVSAGASARTKQATVTAGANPFRESLGLKLSGAKTFRFTANSTGGSDFGQSLDLRISGTLTPGLEITGTISDRGYNPAYGPANSRLSELDRINLELKSNMLTAHIGDIAAAGRFDETFRRDKRVSGVAVNLHTEQWYAQALVARPKGRFATYTFSGVDGLQGPYQIGEGADIRPIVPSSEQVWLDGRLLERGAHKDYTIDYATGRITFSVKHPIDSRSRIEIDYEPRSTAYRGELLTAGAGVALGDSSVQLELEWLREGDDKNLPMMGDLSSGDRDLLATVGDNAAAAVRSGVTADSNGAYVLVADSLPDSVYQYVGVGNGQYSLSFSMVGAGQGDYRYLGGDRYEYVGRGQGDYQPIVIIPLPERTDYYNARIRVRNELVGELTAQFRQTVFDRNLFSSRDDNDNQGLFFSLAAAREWRWNEHTNRLSITARRKQANYKVRDRLYPADFRYRFLFPNGFTPLTDETWYEVRMTLSPTRFLNLSPSFSQVDYRRSFRSATGGIQAVLTLHRNLGTQFRWQTLKAGFDTLTTEKKGSGSVYAAGLSYCFAERVRFTANYEHDRREHEYTGRRQGTRYDRSTMALEAGNERFSYEHYVEDSLMPQWTEILQRHRLAVGSNRRLGLLSINTDLAVQWLNQSRATDRNFLGWMLLQYHNAVKRLEVNASYSLSEETRHARGIGYLEVEPGQGEYILENGEYVPDPNGNYIRVEEILSDRSRVSRGEKSFRLAKDFTVALFRFNANIQEELLNEGKRLLWWAVPFFSDETQPYLFYLRRYDADIRLFPIRSAHAVNITASDEREIRTVAGAAKGRHDAKGALTLKQAVRNTFFEETIELFQNVRDLYFSRGGKTDGYKIGVNLRRLIPPHELSAGGAFRRARTSQNERSQIYSIHAGTRLRVVRRGEIRASLELYRQKLSGTVDVPSFLLTGNRPGSKGAVWSVSLRYGVKGGLRINVSLSGRHSDDRPARITGRGEMVAGF